MKFVDDISEKYFDTGVTVGGKKIYRSKRLESLRNYLLGFEPELCTERAVAYTESYKETESDPICIRRAKAFKRTVENMTVLVLDHELLAGNLASKPRGVPIFPEFSINWLIEELNGDPVRPPDRPGDMFNISAENEKVLREIADYWRGRTHEDRCLARVPEEAWKAHQQGAFNSYWLMTGGEGHLTVGLKRVAYEGLESFKKQAEERIGEIDPQDRESVQKLSFLRSVLIYIEAIVNFARRYAALAREKAAAAQDEQRRKELLLIAEICERVPEKPARNFHEALQAYWFTNLCLEIENNGFAVSLGRMDKNLYPFYKADIESGLLTEEDANELLGSFFLKIFQLNRIQNWESTQFFGGYQTFQNITIGGQDENGADSTNDLTYRLLETQAKINLHQPSLSLRYHDRISNRVLQAALDCIQLGGGQPALYSDESYLTALINRGISLEDASDYSIVGCAEAIIEGKQSNRPSGSAFINLGKIMEIAVNGGMDPATNTRLIDSKGLLGSETFKEFYEDFKEVYAYYVRQQILVDTCHDTATEEGIADPLVSLLVEDCINRGKTIKQGGSKYDYLAPQFVGVANIGNSLAAIKKIIYEDKSLSKEQLLHALATNFEDDSTNPTGKEINRMLADVPKYGNDNDYVDSLMVDSFRFMCEEECKYKTTRYGRGPIGGQWQPSVSSVSSNVPHGLKVGALPDGRVANTPLSDTTSPMHGTDVSGPTASLKSVSKLPSMLVAGGQLLNMRLNPASIQKAGGREKFISLIRTFLGDLKGMHIQFNMIDSETLKDAQKRPEEYKDLMVRVAGYSALFTPLDPELQNDIIARTEHML